MKALLVMLNSDVHSTKRLLGALKENVPPNFLDEWVIYFGVEPGTEESAMETHRVGWAATVKVQFNALMGETWGVNTLAAQAFRERASGVVTLESSMGVSSDYWDVANWYLEAPRGPFLDMGGYGGGRWDEFSLSNRLNLEGGLVVSKEAWHSCVQRNWGGRLGWKDSIMRWVRRERMVVGSPSVGRAWPGSQERKVANVIGASYAWKT